MVIDRKGLVLSSCGDPGFSATMAAMIVEAPTASDRLTLQSFVFQAPTSVRVWEAKRYERGEAVTGSAEHCRQGDGFPGDLSARSVGAGTEVDSATSVISYGEGLGAGLKLRTAGASRSRDTATGSLEFAAQGNRVRGFPCL